MPELNWIFIILAAIVPIVFGAIWYSEGVSQLITGEKSKGRSHPAPAYMLCFLLSIPIAVMISILMSTHEAVDHNPAHIAFHGAMLAAFVVMPVLFIHFTFEGDRSIRNMIYHILYWVITFGIMGAIVGASFPANSVSL